MSSQKHTILCRGHVRSIYLCTYRAKYPACGLISGGERPDVRAACGAALNALCRHLCAWAVARSRTCVARRYAPIQPARSRRITALIINTKSVLAIRTLIKHGLAFIGGSQLHGIKFEFWNPGVFSFVYEKVGWDSAHRTNIGVVFGGLRRWRCWRCWRYQFLK